MTLSDDLNFAEHGGEFNSETPAHPVIFGIAFTPKIIGILVGVIGLAGAGYILLNLLMPALESYQQQQAKSSELQGQIEQKKANIKQIDKVKQELAQAKQQKVQVLALFANEKSLDTLLLDLNRLIESGNTPTSVNAVRAKLKKFVPVSQKPEPIIDGTLGLQVDGKLERSSINAEITGTYEQTQSIIRNIERLQPLLIVKDYQATLAPVESRSPLDKTPVQVGPAAINTSFQLQVLMPLSAEEIAAAAAKAAPKK
ncbi:pilus assembly protein PilO [Nostoc sp. 'Peltigera membranacea cyanobiont' 213]|uniref:pilus assembly protein PilO n=1 Tax=unclassified Nostoc TaxID=2593658 RepID=UPI000B955F69|nr:MULTISPECIES: pilus assembly protein PilO [unclassified Nostoc]AVH67558.1 type IV pilus assembly protein PilO [Nostoc sp. 'Peltigera membranacea cyanobiont' N6]OYD87604.1 pilus assembly protein PilO [Nostoc sp. 'Peltigera membranacea cyanobiont' 213]